MTSDHNEDVPTLRDHFKIDIPRFLPYNSPRLSKGSFLNLIEHYGFDIYDPPPIGVSFDMGGVLSVAPGTA